jgi:hypothetical protein
MGFGWRETTQTKYRSDHVSHSRYSTQQYLIDANVELSRPALGFGTFQDADAQEEAVLKALRLGYRHVDTAKV